MKKYEEYQDSGVDWMGEIPAHWKAKRNKFCFSYKKGKMPLSTTDIAGDNTPVYLAMDYLRGNPKQIFYVDKLEGATIVNDGDMLLLWDGSNAGEFVPARTGVLSSTMAHLSINSNIENKFAWYFLKAFEPQLKSSTIGMGIPHVDGEELMNGSFVVPPLPEQRAIAAYLDRKTAQLDTLLAQKEALLQMLHQKRQALINEAVTQGLDPAAPRKPSGVEWLGDVPAHWEIKRLKQLTSKIGSGVTPLGGANVYEDHGIPLFRSQNVYPNGLRLDDVAFISEEVHQSMKNSQVETGDVLLNITGASIGRCYFYQGKNKQANVNQHVCIIRPNEQIGTEYLYFSLASNLGQHQIDISQNGASREGLTFTQLREFRIACPSISEQKEIVRTVNLQLYKINEATAAIHTQIKTLKAYRQSLISEVVTGKVDVRTAEAVAPEADLPLWRQ